MGVFNNVADVTAQEWREITSSHVVRTSVLRYEQTYFITKWKKWVMSSHFGTKDKSATSVEAC